MALINFDGRLRLLLLILLVQGQAGCMLTSGFCSFTFSQTEIELANSMLADQYEQHSVPFHQKTTIE